MTPFDLDTQSVSERGVGNAVVSADSAARLSRCSICQPCLFAPKRCDGLTRRCHRSLFYGTQYVMVHVGHRRGFLLLSHHASNKLKPAVLARQPLSFAHPRECCCGKRVMNIAAALAYTVNGASVEQHNPHLNPFGR